ncbi:MAG: nicotinamide riboside transporter PnuC [Nitritalea sp.]
MLSPDWKAWFGDMRWETLSPLEAVAVFFGIVSVLFSIRKHIAVFPTGIISTCIYLFICWEYKLYADMGINGYYTVMSVYGWWLWAQPKGPLPERPVSWMLPQERWISAGLFLGSYGLLYILLSQFTDSDVPYWDSFTTSSAFVAMWLMAKKKVENWIFWIITDLVSVPLYLYKGLPLTAFQFAFFTVLAVIGLRSWYLTVQRDKQAKVLPHA